MMFLSSCDTLLLATATIPETGSFSSVQVMDVKQQNDNIVVLYARSVHTYTDSLGSHGGKTTLKKKELYIGEVTPTDLLDKNKVLHFRKVGEVTEGDPIFQLNIIVNGIELVQAEEQCSIYKGPCQEQLTESSYKKNLHNYFSSSNIFVEVNSRKYEINAGLSK